MKIKTILTAKFLTALLLTLAVPSVKAACHGEACQEGKGRWQYLGLANNEAQCSGMASQAGYKYSLYYSAASGEDPLKCYGTNEERDRDSNNSNNESSCFIAGTMVATPYGEKHIENISVGDPVIAYDEDSRKIVVSKVTAVLRHALKSYGILSLEDGTEFKVTPEHRFLIRSGISYKWVTAGELNKGAVVMKLVNTGVGFAFTERIVSGFAAPKDVADVYNIEVETYHTYIANGVLVHNAKIRM